MSGTADGKPLCDSLHNTKKDNLQQFYKTHTNSFLCSTFLLNVVKWLFPFLSATCNERILFIIYVHNKIRTEPMYKRRPRPYQYITYLVIRKLLNLLFRKIYTVFIFCINYRLSMVAISTRVRWFRSVFSRLVTRASAVSRLVSTLTPVSIALRRITKPSF